MLIKWSLHPNQKIDWFEEGHQLLLLADKIMGGNTTEEYAICYGQFETMDRDSRLLVTNEPVEVQNFRNLYQSFFRNMWNIPQINEEKLKDYNM